MPRLFISHSSRDNVDALAFRNWLVANGWSADDVFIDLHGIGAGERWRDTLRKANAACEAVILLASPHSLDSAECQREINLAEDLGKQVIVAILRDLDPRDARLVRFADRQFVDLSRAPTEKLEPFEHDGRLHRVEFHLPALLAIKARLADLGIAPGSFAWTPTGKDVSPYPGLAAFGEDDAGIFFGREAEIMAGLTRLRWMRRRRSPRLLVIQAASGAGKSSYLRAGLWPRLKRDPDFAPVAILRPALGILTGPDGVGRRVAPWFERHGRTKVPGDINAKLAGPGSGALLALASLLAEATDIATTVRRAGAPDAPPPAPLLAIDQGEELFASENATESDRFLEVLAALLKEPPPPADPYVLMTIRADSLEPLLQRWPALGLDPPELLPLTPLPSAAYRDIILKPAEVYARQVKRLTIEPDLVNTLAKDTEGADALPLLAFTLEKLFHEFGADGTLTEARYQSMGGIGGSIDRALAEAQRLAGAIGTADNLRRLIVPGLATWDPAANAAKRIVAVEADLLAGTRANLAPLVKALVDNRLLTRGPGTLEVAHEALLRREPIATWLADQKDALKLRDDVLKEAKDWTDGGRHDEGLVRRGARLEAARALQQDETFTSALAPASAYLAACQALEVAGLRRARRTWAAVVALMMATIAGLLGVIFKETIGDVIFEVATVQPYRSKNILPFVLTPAKETALKPGDTFQDCGRSTHCPVMVVVPAGTFRMGSPDSETGRFGNEGPLRTVTIAKPLAVGKFEINWDEWETCVAMRGCDGRPTGDATFGKGQRPVINVSWDQAQTYATWLSRMTGKTYQLLSEAEWEYAARAGTQTAYSFGNDPAAICRHANLADQSYKRRGYTGDAANCDDGQATTAPVGQYPPNGFGLHDMHGNVWEWVQDCYQDSYDNAPTDGSSAAERPGCFRVLRGGSWGYFPQYLRAAQRLNITPDDRGDVIGFRLARTLPHTP